MQTRAITLKPQSDIVEYGVVRPEYTDTPTDQVPSEGGWIVHGVQIPFVLNASTTGQQVLEACTQDAIAKGFLSAP